MPNDTGFGDETLHGVLHAMFVEFIEGDFEMIRVFIRTFFFLVHHVVIIKLICTHRRTQ